MTDRTGILQHAIFTVPNFEEGYCTDDNARAFLLTVLLDELNPGINPAEINAAASTYLAFLWYCIRCQEVALSELRELRPALVRRRGQRR